MINIKVDWKRLSISLLLIVLSVSSYMVYRTLATPSGQTGSIEGGGFCQGTYTIFNNTGIDNRLYAQNCATGANDFNSADLGTLLTTNVFPAMPHGGEVHLRNGFFGVLTSIIFSTTCASLCDTSLTLSGSGIPSGHAANQDATFSNATALVALTNSITMIKSTNTPSSSAPDIRGNVIRDLGLMTNKHTGLVGIDFRMTEAAAFNRFQHIATLSNQFGGSGFGFTVGMYLNGNEDTVVSDSVFNGDGNLNDGSSTNDIQWIDTFGNPDIEKTFFGGQYIIIGSSDNAMLRDDTFQGIRLGQSSSFGILTIDGGYFNGLTAGVGENGGFLINLNGINPASIQMTGGFFDNLCGGTSTGCTFLGSSSAVTLTTFGVSSSLWQFGSVSNSNFLSSVTITKSVTTGSNHVLSGGTPTGFPFTVDANGNF